MLMRVVRMLIGLMLASLAAAATLVLFVYVPGDWASLRAGLGGGQIAEAAYFAVRIAPQVAAWVAVPGLVAAAFAETRGIAGWAFYALAGLGIAASGYLIQFLADAADPEGFLPIYALAGFLTAGAVGGLAYWAAAGRSVPRPPAPTPAQTPPAPGAPVMHV
jgi:hypothetical protein